MTTSFPPISYPSKPVPPFTATPPNNLFPFKFPTVWRDITGKPYITVSAKGLANGSSEHFNDGADFGPDTPGTQTSGIQEAITYTFYKGGGTIVFMDGIYDVSDAPMQKDPLTGQQYQIAIPANSPSNPTVEMAFIAHTKTHVGLGGVIDTSTGGVIIQNVNSQTFTNSMTGFIMGAFYYDDPNGGSNVNLWFDGIGFKNSDNANNFLGCLDVHQAISASFGTLAIKSSYTGEAPLNYNQATGLYWMTGGAQTAPIYAYVLDIEDQQFGLFSDLPHAQVNNLTFYYCKIGWLNYSGTEYAPNIGRFEAQITQFGIEFSLPLAVHIGTYAMGDQSSTGNFAYNSSIYYSNSSYAPLVDISLFDLGTSGITPAFPINGNGIINIKAFGLEKGLLYNPEPSLSANPPVSGTVYQNTNPYDIEIDLPVYATTSGTAGYVTIAKGSTDTPTAISNQYVSGDTSSTSTQIIRLRVPAGWYYSFTGSGVTFATATPFAE